MDVWTRRYFSYFLAIFSVYTLLVYSLNIPELISGAPDLIKEYYYKNAIRSVILDTVLILIYIAISMYIVKLFKLKENDIAVQFTVLAITTFLLTTLFMIYFINYGSKKHFFTRWFKRVGLKAGLYDVIIVGSVFLLMISINKKIK